MTLMTLWLKAKLVKVGVAIDSFGRYGNLVQRHRPWQSIHFHDNQRSSIRFVGNVYRSS